MTGVLDLTYTLDDASPPVSTCSLYDLFRGLSIVNSKNHEYTTRDGHVKGVLCDITIQSDKVFDGDIFTAPNSWRMRNAFRKFHFAREKMFRDAGVSKSEMGTYGQTIRPYFDAASTTSAGYIRTYLQLRGLSTVGDACPGLSTAHGGEWDRSQFASAVAEADGVEAGGIVSGLDFSDSWNVHICDAHIVESMPIAGDEMKYTSVGMINAYNQDRMDVITPTTAGEVVDAPNNPLASLQSQTVTSGDVLEIAQDQELEAPPYDLNDAGDSIQAVLTREFKTTLSYDGTDPTVPYANLVRLKNVFLPAGYAAFSWGSYIADAKVTFHVKGIVECREFQI